MNITVQGSGPAVVLVHGAPSSPDAFGELARALAHDHRVLIPSLPGYRSPRLEPYTLAGVEQQLVAALRERGVTRAALVGFSGGAYRVLSMAVNGFDAPAIACLGGFAYMTAEERAGMAELAAAMRGMPDFTALRDIFVGRMLHAPSRAAEVLPWLDATTPAVLADELAAFADAEDLRPRLGALRAKMLVRTGEHDAASPAAHAIEIARACGVEAQIVRGVGHALLVEDAPATIAAIRDLVA